MSSHIFFFSSTLNCVGCNRIKLLWNNNDKMMKVWPKIPRTLKPPATSLLPPKSLTSTVDCEKMIEVTHNQASQPSLAEGAIQTSNHAVAQQEQVVIQAPTSDRKHPTLPQRARAYSEVVSAAVPVVHAMKPTKNENNVSPNEDGDQCEKKAISPTATTNSNVSTDVAETAPSSTVSSRKHALNTSYKHTPPYVMRNADATASSPTFDIHSFLCTANTTMWVEWLTQGGDLNGFDMNFYHTDDVDWMDDPLQTIPFPRWMSHGISKYLLLSLGHNVASRTYSICWR
jgi:hypothetical protein